MRSIDPHSGLLITPWDTLTPNQIETRLKRATAAALTWRATDLPTRCAHLLALADALLARVDALALLMAQEVGKPLAEGRAEVTKCAWVCRYYAEHAADFLAPTPIDTGADTQVRYDPLGVVLAVMPWNFPLWQVLRFAAPALAAGNVLLMKHAPNTQGCADAIAHLVRDAGLPSGVLQNLPIDVGRVADVIAHPAVAAVTLTGSERAGAAVGAVAGEHLKRAVLELGGSDAFIVLGDADLEAAVAQGVTSRCLNSGQSCIAAKRFLIQRDVLEAFTSRFVAAMQARIVGDPQDPATQVGPLARADLRDALHDQVQRSLAAGATLLCGGEVPPGPGFYYPPTVLGDVTEDMPVATEETFGPVAALIPCDDGEHAVQIANRSRYGLGASVWTADRALAHRMAEGLDVGCVFVNRMTVSDPRVPFGGVKMSGYGRELGVFGLREFVNVKTVWVE